MQNKWINRTEPSEVIKIISIGYGHNFQRTNISLLSWCQYFTYMKPKFCTEIWQDEELLQRILCKLLEAGGVLLSDSLQFHFSSSMNAGKRLSGGCRGREGRAPPEVPNSFNFMQFSGNLAEWYVGAPPTPPGSWRPHLGEILDPPLLRTHLIKGKVSNLESMASLKFQNIVTSNTSPTQKATKTRL